jgi:O-antigen/teichoic acid export membrane protein
MEGKGKKPSDYPKMSGPRIVLGTIAILATAVCSYYIIKIWFGAAWVLPFGISVMISTQEFLRGVFHSRLMYMISVGGSRDVTLVSTILIILTLVLTLPGVYFLGLWGLCTAILLMYSIVNIVIAVMLHRDSFSNSI